ncbi:MAG: hypothetical protein GKR92_06560 [Gammaproteobacteria bacterium]|nr:MAG: hypothetical protein GKR92_06560 [Gammaproteobacteria bacterium]
MRVLTIFLLTIFSSVCFASEVEIIQVKTEKTTAQKYNVTVTLEHADEGWEHYANAWRIYSAEGELIGERTLHHPHVKEQPFTRSLLGITIPSEHSEVEIVAVCSKTGESKKSYTLKLR